MKLSEIMNMLDLEEIVKITNEKEVDNVYIGDLLSIVMSKSEENDIWITIQTHVNVIAVAALVGISAVIVVEGMSVEQETIDKGIEMNIPIYKTNLSAYDIACKLNEIGI